MTSERPPDLPAARSLPRSTPVSKLNPPSGSFRNRKSGSNLSACNEAAATDDASIVRRMDRLETEQEIPDEIVCMRIHFLPHATNEFAVAAEGWKVFDLLLPTQARTRMAHGIGNPGRHTVGARPRRSDGVTCGWSRRRPVHTIFQRGFRHGPQVLDRGVVLHNGGGIHNVSAFAADCFDHLPAVRFHLVGCSKCQYRVRNATAEAKPLAEDFMSAAGIAAIHVKDDASFG